MTCPAAGAAGWRVAVPSVTWLIDVGTRPLAGCREGCVSPADQPGSSGRTQGGGLEEVLWVRLLGSMKSLSVTLFLALHNLHNTTRSHAKWDLECFCRHRAWPRPLSDSFCRTDRRAAFQRLRAVPPQLLFSLLPRWRLSCRLFGKLIFDNSPGFSCGSDKAQMAGWRHTAFLSGIAWSCRRQWRQRRR